jgi:23S rRNA pseudouridine2457 synthase
MASLLLFNKPYGVLSQFTTKEDKPTLAEYIKVPRVYPAGRLDHDSEGLLLLTDDGDLQHHIAHPAHKQPKTYWVQVEGAPNSYALTQLRQGVALNDGITQPAEVRLIPAPRVWERNPPIRSRVNIPTQWMEITITEGKNRQVRRMTAAVGHPTLRLIRVKIGPWTLEGIEPGTYRTEQINAPKAPAGARRNSRSSSNSRPSTNARSSNNSGPRGNNQPNSTASGEDKARRNQFGQRNEGSTANPRTGRTDRNEKSSRAASPTPRASAPKTVIIQKPRPKLSLKKDDE